MVWTSTRSTSDDSISGTNYFLLKLSEKAFVMAHVLGLRRLQELVQGSSSLQPAPACILGIWYELEGENGDINAQVLEQLLSDFQAKVWCTYRRDFSALGAAQLTSDIGWGCTIRSGQMLLAEALIRHCVGRSWWHEDPEQRFSHPQLLQCLQWVWDAPDTEHPFSIHNICNAGKPHGVVAGQWLGPWVLCKTLEAAVNAVLPWGLHIHVVCDPGGGAPTLCRKKLSDLFKTLSSPLPKGQPGAEHSETAVRPGAKTRAANSHTHAELLLIPLTLGLDKVNPRYLPLLQKVLTLPQSVGIVGGRPSSSLYFVGYQDDNVAYLDPHEPRMVAKLPEDAHSYFCNTLRLMPLSSIDPSLAIGFLCRTAEDMEELLGHLSNLEKEAAGAPLMTIVNDSHTGQSQECEDANMIVPATVEGESKEAGEWELV